jgi:fermentation-respiration switch protein FrsA (DUF1100 family)
MKYLLIILLFLFVTLTILVYVANSFLKYIVNPKKLSSKLSKKIAQKYHYLDFISEENIIEYQLKMEDNYLLPIYVIKNPSNKYVILSHGHTVTHYNSYKYAKLFYDNNYNVIMYDSRGHGDNKESIITLGHLESKDLKNIITDSFNRYGKDIYLGLHGESMGAITSNIVLKYKQNLNFIISDSSFKDEIYHLKYFVKHTFNLPFFMIYFGNIACILKYHFSFYSIAPIKYIKNNTIPICFIHGLADYYILSKNSEKLYDANKGYKEIHLIKNAKHAKCYQTDPDNYIAIVNNFLVEAEKINER